VYREYIRLVGPARVVGLWLLLGWLYLDVDEAGSLKYLLVRLMRLLLGRHTGNADNPHVIQVFSLKNLTANSIH
jgi:hypothetical protein